MMIYRLVDTKISVIEAKIIAHIEYLRDVRKLAYWSINVYCSGIFHFFEMNDISLNRNRIKKFLPSDDTEHYSEDRPYSIEEISRIIDKCDIRSQAVTLLMASTGMRVGAISGLRILDIKNIDEFGLYLIWVYSSSKKDRYYTFCTPECAKAIDDYLAYRKRLGEELKDSSWLIRNKITIDNPFTAKAPKPLGVRGIQLIIFKLCKEAGLFIDKRQVMSTHGFRKFFNQLDKAGVHYTTREYLAGHHLPGQNKSYVRMTEEDRLAEYIKVVELLTISPENRLRKQVAEQEHTIQHKLAEKDKQIEEMMRKQEQFGQLIQSLIDSGQLKPDNNMH